MIRRAARLGAVGGLLAVLFAARSAAGDLVEFGRETDHILAGYPKGFGDPSAPTVHYNCYLATLGVFEERPWFRSWYFASEPFRKSFDEMLARVPVRAGSLYECRRPPPESQLRSAGLLSLLGEPAGAAVTVNGVFVGRLPLSGLVLPAGEYLAQARAPDRVGELNLALVAGVETRATIETAPAPAPVWPPASSPPRGGEQLWRQDVGAEIAESIQVLPQGVVVQVGGDRPALRLYDAATGCLLRETPLSQRPTGKPVLAGGRLVWTTAAGALYAYDPASGETAYLGSLDGEPGPPLLGAGERCFVARRTSQGATVSAFDPAEGRERWSVQVDLEPLQLVVAGQTALLLGRARGGDGGLVAFDGDRGASPWKLPAGNPARAVIAARGGTVFFHGGGDGEQGRVLEAATGQGPRLVLEDGARPAAVALDAQTAYVATSNGRLIAFDRERRLLLWERELPGGGKSRVGRLDAVGDFVTVLVGEVREGGEARGDFFVLDRDSGNSRYSEDVLLADAPAAIGAGFLLVPDLKATPFVRDLERDCTSWRLQSPRPGAARDVASVAVDGGIAYVLGRRRGQLAAYRFGGCLAPIALPDLEPVVPESAPVAKTGTSGTAVTMPGQTQDGRSSMPAVGSAPIPVAAPGDRTTPPTSRTPAPAAVAGGASPAGPAPPQSVVRTAAPPPRGFVAMPILPSAEPRPEASGLRQLAPLDEPSGLGEMTVGAPVLNAPLLRRLAERCAEHFTSWEDAEGNRAAGARPLRGMYRLMEPRVRPDGEGWFSATFGRETANSGLLRLEVRFRLFAPRYSRTAQGEPAIVVGIEFDKTKPNAFRDSVSIAALAPSATDVVAVRPVCFFHFLRSAGFLDLGLEDLTGDGAPETVVRYSFNTLPQPQPGLAGMLYVLNGQSVIFNAEVVRVRTEGEKALRDSAEVVFRDTDGDGVKEILLARTVAPWEELPPADPKAPQAVYRLEQGRYRLAP
jgi:outer membrane protein assembly factor BamB